MTKEEKNILLDRLKDGSTLVKACECYWDATNSTAALVSLLKLREIIDNMYNKSLNLTPPVDRA